MQGIELNPALRELVAKVRADDPNISGIRVGQNAPGVVRLVIDLKQAVQPQVFSLAPVAPYQHRLVFDLYPQKPLDPLEALIAERLRDSQAAATTPKTAAPVAAPVPAASAASASSAAKTLPAHADPLGELIAGSGRRADAGPQASPSAPLPPPAAKPAKTDRLVIVALDPGHGGEDPGAIGPGGTREKDVVLQIAMLLRERRQCCDVADPQQRIGRRFGPQQARGRRERCGHCGEVRGVDFRMGDAKWRQQRAQLLAGAPVAVV